jgi:phosphate transport system substrate-binding protein
VTHDNTKTKENSCMMSITGRRRSLAMSLASLGAVATVATACGSDNGASATTTASNCPSGTVNGAGSTFQQNIEQQWAADFASRCSTAKVTYTGTGSGAGIQQFGAGTIAFAGSDVPMKPEEQSAADKRCGGKAVTFPVTAGGIAIIVNLKSVPSLKLSAATLAGIFQGSVHRWSDTLVAKDNPGVSLPSTPVVSYHRADGSGTTSVFSQFENAMSGGAWKLGTGKTLNWSSGQGANGSDGVVRGVTSTDGGITYAEASFALAHNLPTVAVKGASGRYVSLTTDAVSQSLSTGYTGNGSSGGSLDFTKMTGYPISTVSYAITCAKYADTATGKLVSAYLSYALTSGQQSAKELGYAPLPSALVQSARSVLTSGV